jgi:hypothetical protein
MGQPRVIIADDDVLLREGLASLLDRSGMRVLGPAGAGGPGPDGRGPLQCGIARAAVGHRRHLEKHVRAILTKLGLAETDDDHRRVLACWPTSTAPERRPGGDPRRPGRPGRVAHGISPDL